MEINLGELVLEDDLVNRLQIQRPPTRTLNPFLLEQSVLNRFQQYFYVFFLLSPVVDVYGDMNA